MIEPDPLQGNAVLVDALGAALRRGGNALGTVPDLLKRILREESWREFVTQRGEYVLHEKFADFVVAPPLAGIGASIDLVRRVVGDDTEAIDLLDQALAGQHGGPRTKVNNINLGPSVTPRGTSKEYALRKLRKDSPELHAEVVAGRISAHAAMVKAGFRPATFSVRADSAESVAATLRRRLPPEMLAAIAERLS